MDAEGVGLEDIAGFASRCGDSFSSRITMIDWLFRRLVRWLVGEMILLFMRLDADADLFRIGACTVDETSLIGVMDGFSVEISFKTLKSVELDLDSMLVLIGVCPSK